MNEKPTLVMNAWLMGEPVGYECSFCGQRFLLPEDRNPREGAAELYAAFHDHVREQHPEDAPA